MSFLTPKTPALAEHVEGVGGSAATGELPPAGKSLGALVPVPATSDGLAASIQRSHQEYVASVCEAADKAIETGRRLIELKALVKKEVGHGYWEAYIAEKFPFTSRTAQNYMRLARQHMKQNQKPKTKNEALSFLHRYKSAKIIAAVEQKK